MLPEPITAYLDEQSIPHDDLDASFREIGLDILDCLEMFFLIEEHAKNPIGLKDDVYERWQTLADVAKVARELAA
jgi:acyl carrier protein